LCSAILIPEISGEVPKKFAELGKIVILGIGIDATRVITRVGSCLSGKQLDFLSSEFLTRSIRKCLSDDAHQFRFGQASLIVISLKDPAEEAYMPPSNSRAPRLSSSAFV
jgi:hypothetical protein